LCYSIEELSEKGTPMDHLSQIYVKYNKMEEYCHMIWMAPLPAQINRGMTPEKKKVWN
jgi:hypothetical protein